MQKASKLWKNINLHAVGGQLFINDGGNFSGTRIQPRMIRRKNQATALRHSASRRKGIIFSNVWKQQRCGLLYFSNVWNPLRCR